MPLRRRGSRPRGVRGHRQFRTDTVMLVRSRRRPLHGRRGLSPRPTVLRDPALPCTRADCLSPRSTFCHRARPSEALHRMPTPLGTRRVVRRVGIQVWLAPLPQGRPGRPFRRPPSPSSHRPTRRCPGQPRLPWGLSEPVARRLLSAACRMLSRCYWAWRRGHFHRVKSARALSPLGLQLLVLLPVLPRRAMRTRRFLPWACRFAMNPVPSPLRTRWPLRRLCRTWCEFPTLPARLLLLLRSVVLPPLGTRTLDTTMRTPTTHLSR